MMELPIGPLIVRFGLGLLTARVILIVFVETRLIGWIVIVLVAVDKNFISSARSIQTPVCVGVQRIGVIQGDILNITDVSLVQYVAQLLDVGPGAKMRVDAIVVLHPIAMIRGTPGATHALEARLESTHVLHKRREPHRANAKRFQVVRFLYYAL